MRFQDVKDNGKPVYVRIYDNEQPANERSPVKRGKFTMNGTAYSFGLWIEEGKMSGRLQIDTEPRSIQEPKEEPPKQTSEQPVNDSDIPF